jgi:hypothetical protein
MKIENEFVPYEQALALKELGFDKECFAYFFYNGAYSKWVLNVDNKEYEYSNTIKAPTFSQAFRFFRERHKLYYDIKMIGSWDKPQYSYLVSGRTMNNPAHMWWYENKDSHEEAELACLIKLIEIVKNK